jgi:hypothetical protein
MAIRIHFINFWPEAFTGASDASFLLHVFAEACGPVEITEDTASADVVVTSVFGQAPTPPRKTIQFIGENVRPDLTRYRYSLSYDYDPFGGRNFRLPLWWWLLDWPGFGELSRRRPAAVGPYGHQELIPIDTLMRRRPPSTAEDFCVLVAGNPEPLRMNLYAALRTLGPVTGYGTVFGNPLRASKLEVLRKFRFCLCPENSIYPGYHTEKLVDAWYGGCIPLYSGDRELSREFNPAALLNYQDYLDTGSFLKAVQRLRDEPQFYADVHAQPLLRQRPSLAGLISFLRAAVGQIRREAAGRGSVRGRPMGRGRTALQGNPRAGTRLLSGAAPPRHPHGPNGAQDRSARSTATRSRCTTE